MSGDPVVAPVLSALARCSGTATAAGAAGTVETFEPFSKFGFLDGIVEDCIYLVLPVCSTRTRGLVQVWIQMDSSQDEKFRAKLAEFFTAFL